MKQTKIDLSKPFEKVLNAVLSAPEDDKGIREGAGQDGTSPVFAKAVNRGSASKTELKRVLRCLYEAAHGRQVETQIGLITIAPPVAAFLKERPFYIKTQIDFLLEALTRIIAGTSHANTEIPPPKKFCKKGLVETPGRNNSPKLETKNADAESDLPSKETSKMNHENEIIVTASDHAELSSVVSVTGKVSQRAKWELRLLENELKRAQIMPPEKVPSDVITMNSRAELLDLESGERMEFTLVLPADANINDGKISVLAPLGTAMLGYRVGDTFEWPIPYGIRHLQVIKVIFQPEKTLQQAA